MRISVRKIAPLLFVSGLCALVYQVAWLRELRLVFGASTAASAAVLAIFMGGLGAGGLLLGKRADARRDPLALYAQLELGVAIFAAVTPPLVSVVRALYRMLGGSVALGLGAGSAVRILLAALILLPPTLLMGGTLPAAAKAVVADGDEKRRDLALLYGANTLGAVTGAAASTFVLLEMLGASRMLWVACALNAAIAGTAWVLAKRAGAAGDAGTGTGTGTGTPEAAPRRFVLAAAAIVGFAFLLMELVWYRMLAPILGGSSYTFGLILALALLGVGLGGAAYAAWMDRRPPSLAALGLTCALEALFLAAPYALGDRLAVVAIAVRQLSALGFGGLVLGWSAVAGVVVLPAAFVSGAQFPLLVALLGRGGRGVGVDVGHAYAWNTAGAILGSLAGGFGLLPVLGAPGVWRGVVYLLAALAIGAVVTSRVFRAPMTLAAVIASVLLVRTAGPTAAFRHGGVGAGRSALLLARTTPNQVEDWRRQMRRTVVWEAEGLESSVALSAAEGNAFVVNGKVDGHSVMDGGTQVMSGLIGALLHPDPKRALVVGLGTGSTAGWLGAVPSMERVDVVELEPAVIGVARDCAAANHGVLDNPRVRVIAGDAREVMLTARDRYDLVFSEPSNPYRAGVASLFTREFYATAKARLAPGGVFLQWLQAYEVDALTIESALATLASVFPEVQIWVTESSDLVLVATEAPLPVDVARVRARIAAEPFRTALEKTWRVSDLEGALAHFVASPAFVRAVAELPDAKRNTDDRNLLEFGFARGVGHDAGFSDGEIWALAHARGEDRPAVVGGAVDWDLVEEHQRIFDAMWSRTPRGTATKPDAVKRAEAYGFHVAHEATALVAAWRDQPRAPDGSFALSVVAEALAEAGSEDAVPLIDRLRPLQPSEADAHLARLRWKQGRLDEAMTALEAAIRQHRADPWPRHEVMRRAVGETSHALATNEANARRLFDALKEPFVLSLLEDERREARLRLSARGDLRATCVEAAAAFEPHFPYKGELLTLRRDCYAAVHHPLLAVAERELAAFTRDEPRPFGKGLGVTK